MRRYSLFRKMCRCFKRRMEQHSRHGAGLLESEPETKPAVVVFDSFVKV